MPLLKIVNLVNYTKINVNKFKHEKQTRSDATRFKVVPRALNTALSKNPGENTAKNFLKSRSKFKVNVRR